MPSRLSALAEPANTPRERTPLLDSPGAVSRAHGLVPPAIRFPGHSNDSRLERQDSYGFPASPDAGAGAGAAETTGAGRSSDDTLVDYRGSPHGSNSNSSSTRRSQLSRGDSKVYTSFPRPASSPWEDPSTPVCERQGGLFARFFGGSSESAGDKAGSSSRVGQSGASSSRRLHDGQTDLEQQQSLPGLPKITRECLRSEIQCYGKWMLLGAAPLLLLAIALIVYYARGT